VQPCSTAQTDRAQILIEGARAWSCGTTPANPVGDEFCPSLLQGLANAFRGTGRDPLALPSSLETADGHHGDAGALGKFGLFKTQQGTGGADLFRGNLHEAKDI
jgi:hypothetical protein